MLSDHGEPAPQGSRRRHTAVSTPARRDSRPLSEYRDPAVGLLLYTCHLFLQGLALFSSDQSSRSCELLFRLRQFSVHACLTAPNPSCALAIGLCILRYPALPADRAGLGRTSVTWVHPVRISRVIRPVSRTVFRSRCRFRHEHRRGFRTPCSSSVRAPG